MAPNIEERGVFPPSPQRTSSTPSSPCPPSTRSSLAVLCVYDEGVQRALIAGVARLRDVTLVVGDALAQRRSTRSVEAPTTLMISADPASRRRPRAAGAEEDFECTRRFASRTRERVGLASHPDARGPEPRIPCSRRNRRDGGLCARADPRAARRGASRYALHGVHRPQRPPLRPWAIKTLHTNNNRTVSARNRLE